VSVLLSTLDRTTLERRLEEILAADADTPGAAWTAENLRCDLPGKWEVSRLALAEDGAMAGFLVGSVREGAIHVHRLVVVESHRRRGLGRLLLGEAAAEARSRGLASITLKVAADNEPALDFYRALGFRRDGDSRDPVVLRANAERLELAGAHAPERE
jgi:ribosomal protein S18 acetylase RimI-like enzyme